MTTKIPKISLIRRIAAVVLAICFALPMAAGAQTAQLVLAGIVKNSDTKRPVAGVSISVAGANIGTVTNADGRFTLKIPPEYASAQVVAQQMGYHSHAVAVDRLASKDVTLWLAPSARTLKEVVVRSGDPAQIVAQALERVAKNYPDRRNMFTAFYRETIQKGKRYISVSEAVIDVLKTPYQRRSIYGERVQVKKGRSIISQDQRDTLSVKIMGGPQTPIIADFVKNPDFLFTGDDLHHFDFVMERPVSIDDRLQFVIRFNPNHHAKLDYALCRGLLYIDQQTLTFTKAEFQLDMDDRDLATSMILRRKPRGLRFKPQELSFTVTYKTVDDVAYLNYVKVVTRFKCDWRRRLFSSGYTTVNEMVMVDRDDNPAAGIARRDAFGTNDVFADKLATYWDPDFWADYNIIEPTETLDKAVDRLRRRNSDLARPD